MNREQTDEWKGWMQFLFLMYHWAKVPEAYNLVCFDHSVRGVRA